MSSNISFITGQRLENFLEDYFFSFSSPFRPNLLYAFLAKQARSFSKLAEQILGMEIYVAKKENPLDRIPARFRPLILELGSKGLIKNYRHPAPVGGWPRLAALVLTSDEGAEAGYELDYESAAIKAIAELLERHSLGWKTRGKIKGTFQDLKHKGAVDPYIFQCFSDAELARPGYGKHQIRPDSVFSWISAKSLRTGKRHLIPAQLTSLHYHPLPGEPMLRQPTSNGAAAGTSVEMATYNAICEVIERDAFLIHWLNKITPPRINLESLRNLKNPRIDRLSEMYRDSNIDFTLLEITSDIKVHTFMGIVQSRAPGRPIVFVSAHSDLDIENAIESVLLFGLRAGYWRNADMEKVPVTITTIYERYTFWSNPALRKEVEFLLRGPEKPLIANNYKGADISPKLKAITSVLKDNSLDAFIADITAPEASKAGLWVIMAVIPGLLPLYLSEYFKYSGHPRLFSAPARMGFSAPLSAADLNSMPHPFL